MNDKRGGIRKIERIEVEPGQIVKTKRQGGRFLEAVYVTNEPIITIKRVDKTHYMRLDTGEIKEYGESTDGRKHNLMRTFNELRGLIRTNFTQESKNQLFVTLTYAENMQDKDRLYEDFKDFIRALRRKMQGHKLEYITVAEPQGRGAWHMHVMIKSDREYLFIDNREVTKLWKQGATDTERLKSDDVGNYYVAYFTDITQEEPDNGTVNEEMTKARKKGARLHYYPEHFKFYRCSSGIERPVIEEAPYYSLKENYGEPYYISTVAIISPDNPEQIIRCIQHESYRKEGLHGDKSKDNNKVRRDRKNKSIRQSVARIDND